MKRKIKVNNQTRIELASLIHEVDVTPTRTVKVLDQKGNLKAVFKEDHPTL